MGTKGESRTEILLERTGTLKEVQENIFVKVPGTGYCQSIAGLNGIGKTVLVEIWERKWKEDESKDPNIYYFKTTMVGADNEWDYWASLFYQFREQITEEKLKAAPKRDDARISLILEQYQALDKDERLFSADNPQRRAFLWSTMIESLFRNYAELGIHIIITIDEFERVDKKFQESSNHTGFFGRLFNLSQKGGGKNVTILILSRRRIGTLVYGLDENSNFEDAYPPNFLKGFTYEEVATYLQSLDNYEALSDGAMAAIVNYCGTHPGLLASMGKAIDESGAKEIYGTRRELLEASGEEAAEKEGERITIDTLFRKKRMDIEKTFKRMHELMKKEFVDSEKKESCTRFFKQAFIGPAYDSDEKLTEKLEVMWNYGFIMRKEEESVYQLAGWSKDELDESVTATFAGRKGYEPISPYFVAYMKYHIAPEELEELDSLRTKTEINVREFICEVFKNRFPTDWKDKLEAEAMGTDDVGKALNKKTSYVYALDKMVKANATDIEYTILNVLGFEDYAKIICKYWEEMQPYMQSYTKAELEKDFFYLSQTRNTFDHKNGKIFNEEYRRIAKLLCERVNQDIEDGRIGKKRTEAPKAAEAIAFSGWAILSQGRTFGPAIVAGAISGNTQQTPPPALQWAKDSDYAQLLQDAQNMQPMPQFTYQYEKHCGLMVQGKIEQYAKGKIEKDGKSYVVAIDAQHQGTYQFDRNIPVQVELHGSFSYTALLKDGSGSVERTAFRAWLSPNQNP